LQKHFIFETQFEGHRIHHLGSLANSACSGPIWLNRLADGFHGPQSNISKAQNIARYAERILNKIEKFSTRQTLV